MGSESRTYKATGINLKTVPMGESDRLVTILTKEYGLLRVIAPGARKHKSRLGGRSGLFVVNELLLTKGKSLDKMIQAETQQSFPGLSTELARLTTSQYLAELVLCEAMSDHPQEALFDLLIAYLEQLEKASKVEVLAYLAQATFHLLALAGVAPEVYQCCVTRQPLSPDFTDPDWRVGFCLAVGGTVSLAEFARLRSESTGTARFRTAEAGSKSGSKLCLNTLIGASELALMQQLGRAELVFTEDNSLPSLLEGDEKSHQLWLRIERLLRQYAQYHFDRPIRSAALIDTCFVSPTYAS